MKRWIEGGGYVNSPARIEKFIRQIDTICERYGFALTSSDAIIIDARDDDNKMRLLDAMMSAEVAEVIDAEDA